MTIKAGVTGLLQRSPYRPVLTHPQLRRVLPGIAFSSLGGGMSPVAISWLVLAIAPHHDRGLWVAMAVAANILPGAIGAFTLGRWCNGRPGSQLAGWDALLRAVFFTLIPVAYALGDLNVGVFVGLLAVSSLLQAWGKAGRYTMLSELLPDEHRLAGNSLVNVLLELSTILGPLIAALIIAHGSPAWVLAAAALTYFVLAGTYKFAVPPEANARVRAGASRAAGFRAVRGDRRLLGLLALSFGFFACYGPVTVALPLYVSLTLHASAATLASFYTAFGIGAVAGAYASGHMQKWPLAATAVGAVLCFGLALLPLGLGFPVVACWVAFGICGASWGPFPTATTTLFQRGASPETLPQVLAARQAMTGLAVPLGAMLGAPAVTLLGARGTLLTSACALTAMGVAAALLLLGAAVAHRRTGRRAPAEIEALAEV